MFERFIKPVYAHCDVPCGIYETDTMKHAAETCRRMVEKYNELGDTTDPEHQNQFVRVCCCHTGLKADIFISIQCIGGIHDFLQLIRSWQA